MIQRIERHLKPPKKPIPSVGTDPGKSAGAMAYVDGLRVVWVLDYVERSKHYEANGHRYPHAWDALCSAGFVPPGTLWTCEDLKPHPGKTNGFAQLAEAKGWASAWAMHRGLVIGKAPDPGRWRSDMLDLRSATGAEMLEAAALAAVYDRPVSGGRHHIHLGLQNVPEGLSGHAAEAILIALWGAGWRLEPLAVS